MFESFETFDTQLSGARLFGRIGGRGPAILLLHGHPRTHATWCKVAPILARDFTVVCPDLRGFGRSSQPEDTMDHRHSSKREKARDCVELMEALGLPEFGIVGHDRGGYTAFRCAMDYPERVNKLLFLGAVPIVEAFERARAPFALSWWHWFFFCIPDKPERAINSDPIAWYRPDKNKMGEENYEDFCTAARNPSVVHGMIEDYRAGAAVDRWHDADDRDNGRKIKCPTRVLWSSEDGLEELYFDILEIWKPWAARLSGYSFPSGHHMAEEAPERLAEEITQFFRAADGPE